MVRVVQMNDLANSKFLSGAICSPSLPHHIVHSGGRARVHSSWETTHSSFKPQLLRYRILGRKPINAERSLAQGSLALLTLHATWTVQMFVLNH